jgi:putative ABC transport system ATP-binding protein
LPLLYSGVTVDEKKVDQAIASVELTHRKQYLSNQLSGGEKQRVAIARALVNNPDIIFADEPTGNLDSRSGTQIMAILQKLNADGHTIILVTHETNTAKHAKRIVRIRDGEIVSDEKNDEQIIAEKTELVK